ncbi:hypothetical protein PCANB_001344 [Pneumocystis canis]|nr:hypothetical protein PCK1_001334 [Pneumocystis canis]KAG5436934.1 hypothetical protein PCANB_001344 [Pneumocystis canis]
MLKMCSLNVLNTGFKIRYRILNQLSLSQIYQFCSKSSTINPQTLTYSGHLITSVKSIKIFSIGSLYLTYLISPIILFADAHIDFTIRLVMTIIALGTTSLSTALVHFVLSPYVMRAQYSNNVFQIETLNLLGKKTIWTGNAEELKENKTGRLFANIESIKGKKRWFYMHRDQQGLEFFKIINSMKSIPEKHKP